MVEYKVTVSQQAAEMLVKKAAFLARVSPSAAERLIAGFEKSAKSLEYMPARCPYFNAEYIPENKYRYIIFEKRYFALFQINGDSVYIGYVPDAREDYKRFLHIS